MKDFRLQRIGVPIVECLDISTESADVQEEDRILIIRRIGLSTMNEKPKHCRIPRNQTSPVEKGKANRLKELARGMLPRQWLTKS